MTTLYGKLPKHNDRREAWTAKVLSVASEFSTEEMTRAILHLTHVNARNVGIAFDDTRARYKNDQWITALEAAVAVKANASERYAV